MCVWSVIDSILCNLLTKTLDHQFLIFLVVLHLHSVTAGLTLTGTPTVVGLYLVTVVLYLVAVGLYPVAVGLYPVAVFLYPVAVFLYPLAVGLYSVAVELSPVGFAVALDFYSVTNVLCHVGFLDVYAVLVALQSLKRNKTMHSLTQIIN